MNYKIGGLSGGGKSTVLKELKKRGYKTIEADEVFGYFADPKTGEPIEEGEAANWFWKKEKVFEELKDSEEPVFVCGGSNNDEEFRSLFTKTFTLYADDEIMKKRLSERTGDSIEKVEKDFAQVFEWNKGIVKYSKERGFIPINTNKTIEEVADEILSYV